MSVLLSPTGRRAALALSAAACLGALIVLLPATRTRWWLLGGIALSIAAHVVLARTLKAILAAVTPLGSGAPEAATYERSVYGTPGRRTFEVVAAVVLSGLVIGTGIVIAWGWVSGAGFMALMAAVALDLQRWERVGATADWVRFQRGWGRQVHQLAIAEIRDISIHEHEAVGFTLRHGTRNRVCRLNLRMGDDRIVALPKTDALADLDAVESVANHIRTRQQLMGELAARRRGHATGTSPPVRSPDDKAMARELKKLRLAASKGGMPERHGEFQRPPQP